MYIVLLELALCIWIAKTTLEISVCLPKFPKYYQRTFPSEYNFVFQSPNLVLYNSGSHTIAEEASIGGAIHAALQMHYLYPQNTEIQKNGLYGSSYFIRIHSLLYPTPGVQNTGRITCCNFGFLFFFCGKFFWKLFMNQIARCTILIGFLWFYLSLNII